MNITITPSEWRIINHFMTGLAMNLPMVADGRVASTKDIEAMLATIAERIATERINAERIAV